MTAATPAKPRGAMVERTCQCCGGKFTARFADVKRGWALFCSKRCKATKQEVRVDLHDNDMASTEQGWDAHKGSF